MLWLRLRDEVLNKSSYSITIRIFSTIVLIVIVHVLPVHARLVHPTVKQTDGSYVRPGAEKYKIFRSDMITHVDLSTIGVVNQEANDTLYSILQVCAELEVGVV